MQQNEYLGQFLLLSFYQSQAKQALNQFCSQGAELKGLQALRHQRTLESRWEIKHKTQFREKVSLHLYSALGAEMFSGIVTLLFGRTCTLPAAAKQNIRRCGVVVTLSVTFMPDVGREIECFPQLYQLIHFRNCSLIWSCLTCYGYKQRHESMYSFLINLCNYVL